MNDDGTVSVPLSWSEQYETLKAERDRLRAVVEQYRRTWHGTESRSALIAERDRLRDGLAALVATTTFAVAAINRLKGQGRIWGIPPEFPALLAAARDADELLDVSATMGGSVLPTGVREGVGR